MRKLRCSKGRHSLKVAEQWVKDSSCPARPDSCCKKPPEPVPVRPGLRTDPASLRSARGLVQRGYVPSQGHTALGSRDPAPPGPPPGTLVRGPGGPRAHLAHPAAPGSIAPAGPEPGRAAAHRRRPSSLLPGVRSAPPPWNSDPARKGRGRALKGAVPFSGLRPRGGRRRPPTLIPRPLTRRLSLPRRSSDPFSCLSFVTVAFPEAIGTGDCRVTSVPEGPLQAR